jgi:transcriptional regulator with XRE-family HTH domain
MNAAKKLQIMALRGYTQHELARIVGATQPTICRVMKGLQVPSEPLVREIDKAFLDPKMHAARARS